MEAKQYATLPQMDLWRNQRGYPKSTWRKVKKKKKNDLKSMGYRKSSSKGQVYGNTILAQETRIISNKQPKLALKGTHKRRTNKSQS